MRDAAPTWEALVAQRGQYPSPQSNMDYSFDRIEYNSTIYPNARISENSRVPGNSEIRISENSRFGPFRQRRIMEHLPPTRGTPDTGARKMSVDGVDELADLDVCRYCVGHSMRPSSKSNSPQSQNHNRTAHCSSSSLPNIFCGFPWNSSFNGFIDQV
ncbi:hypothetical protein Y032_0049g1866 [Ancylostoma ceylanicum]|nr:hypothetical protein Y032_0049g1866 [Ancylostoma ceylanicum]